MKKRIAGLLIGAAFIVAGIATRGQAPHSAVISAVGATGSGVGACVNQVVTALHPNAGPTCTTITGAYVSSPFTMPGNLGITGIVPSYNGVALVARGVPSAVALPAILTGQSSDVGATTIYAVPAGGQGRYEVCLEEGITQAATTSSVLPNFIVIWTSAIDSVAKSTLIGTSGGDVGNNTGTANAGCASVYAKASTDIQYLTYGYASVGITDMEFYLAAIVEAQ